MRTEGTAESTILALTLSPHPSSSSSAPTGRRSDHQPPPVRRCAAPRTSRSPQNMLSATSRRSICAGQHRPGMAITAVQQSPRSRCSALTVRAALGLINQELDAYLAEQDGSIDPDTASPSRVRAVQLQRGDSVTRRAARAKIPCRGFDAAGLVVTGRGKSSLSTGRNTTQGCGIRTR